MMRLRSHSSPTFRRWVAVSLALVALTGPVAVIIGVGTRAAAASPDSATTASSDSGTVVAPQYLALGGSASVGVQPTLEDPHGEPTDLGYADDLVQTARTRWPGLELTELGCPGESTNTMLTGGGRCHFDAGTQLAEAIAFLHQYPETRLVTVDLGFNDVRRCMDHDVVDQPCANRQLALVDRQLPAILSSLVAAAPAGVEFVGVGHYDPFLALARDGRADHAFADASLVLIERLDAVLRSVYARFGMPMADVLGAFDSTDTAIEDGRPVDVARVCDLTWMCVSPPLGPNLHPDDRGYQVIAEAVSRAIPAVEFLPVSPLAR